jgi:GNAT superfamily N-acetyltransferase
MFDAMGRLTGDDGWESVAREVFEGEMGAGRLVAAVVDAPDGSGHLAASGVVQFEARLPSPDRTSRTKAYLSSMSTDPRWRGRGYATDVLALLMTVCEEHGAHAVDLHATDQGRPIYERAGFSEPADYPALRRRIDHR